MIRHLSLLLALVLGTGLLGAQDLGKTDRLWRLYLSETVRRGLPVPSGDPAPGVVPHWPAVDQARAEARSLEPGPDFELVDSWIDLSEGRMADAVRTLRNRWPKPALGRFSPRQWGETLFGAWSPSPDPGAWTQAWLVWEDKAYSPLALGRGIEVMERTDPSAVGPLLDQARRLYPEDRRFLLLALRHPESVANAADLAARDLLLTGGWSDAALLALLDRQPQAGALLTRAGYPDQRISQVQSRDYGLWLTRSPSAPVADGVWSWDSDQDGWAESRLVFQGGHLDFWTRTVPEGSRWTLAFSNGKPDILAETRDGARWTLRFEAYPLASSLEYRWGDRAIVYRFRPLTQSVPLWPTQRFTAPPERLPAALAELWLPLDPRALALQAASIESWDGGVLVQTVHLFQGEVWLQVEDTDRNGKDDTWSYFRSGRLWSVYRDPEGRGQATLRELYRLGELNQVQARAQASPRAEFALFPAEGVQLWDLQGRGRPLDRIFVWPEGGRMDALVFQGPSIPWETMPVWEPRP